MSGLKNWWKPTLAVIAVIAILYYMIFHWSRFVADFYPFDASRISPNLVASVVQYAVLLVAAYLLYPPFKRAVDAFATKHVDSIKNHVSAEHKKLHDRLDRHTAKIDHIILNSKDIPNKVPGIEDKHQP
jgi:TRAP-type uncharacterized transport system fused permease subunit